MRNIVSPLDGIRSPFGPPFGFSPLSLFAAGEPGAWYDPSDFSTMFTDAAGTTPVTAVEQPVGLLLDKSKGLALGAELVTNGDFSNGTTGWVSGSGNTTLTVVSGEAKSEINVTSAISALLYRTTTFATSGVLYKIEFDVYSPNYSGSIRCSLNGSYLNDGFSFTTNVTTTKTRVTSYLRAGASPDLYITASNLPAGTVVYFDNISAKQVTGNHAKQSTEASRPLLKQDDNGKYYLLFDGTDDNLATSSIDFTATSKITVFAGIRKLTESTGIIFELGHTGITNGSFVVYTASASNYATSSRGSIEVGISSAGSFTAPITNVITAAADIPNDQLLIRVNGVQSASSSSNQGTGNYSNSIMFLGMRSGSAYLLNARLYSLIVRGAQSSDPEIASTETWVNSKTGAY